MKVVVIGGGIAGVCCAEELTQLLQEGDEITLVSASHVLKGVQNVQSLTQHVEEFEIVTRAASSFSSEKLCITQGIVTGVHLDSKEVLLSNGDRIAFDKLCISSGARPKVLHPSQYVMMLRDMYSVHRLQERLKTAKRVMVVGNGGIALDLMCTVSVSHFVDKVVGVLAYFDQDTAEFLIEEFSNASGASTSHHRRPFADRDLSDSGEVGCIGEALGPNWLNYISVEPPDPADSGFVIEKECHVATIDDLDEYQSGNVRVCLSNGHVYVVDVVIAAIGVDPFLSWVPDKVQRARDGGLLVDRNMQTSEEGIYAAGDCCTMDWGDDPSPHWFQMRLWTQAKLTGIYAAQCIAGTSEGPGIQFELFTHVTHFLGKKIILLGQYNLENDGDADVIAFKRITETDDGCCYSKVILRGNRVQGAILIGHTELEETMENLILDKLDVSHYGERLLDPDIDHIFD